MHELLILLRANIKKQKSTFISVMLLTLIVTSVMTAIISTEDNYKNGLAAAFDAADSGDAVIFMKDKTLTDELKKSIEDSPLTDRIDCCPALITNGISSGSRKDGNSCMLMKLRDGIKLYTPDLSGFEKEIPALKSGEVYLPLGYMGKIDCNVGGTVTFNAADCERDFTVKGFVQEPFFGSQTIGWKQVFIGDEDYDTLFDLWSGIEREDNGKNLLAVFVSVHKAADCKLDPGKFLRQLNLETKITDLAFGAMSRLQSERFSTLLPDVLIKLFSVFVVFLFIIVLVLISHSVSTEIRSGYVTFGILKSVGFSRGRLTGLFFVQYLLSELLGIILGIALSLPLELMLSNGCKLITAVLPASGISVLKALLLTAIIIAATSAVIFIKTLPLNKISPVKAINGVQGDVYFDSRLQMPISKRLLTASLALRQFTSAKRRYISVVFISMILMFFMLTVNLTINLLNSGNALRAMGIEYADISFHVRRSMADEYIPDVKEFVNSITDVTETFCSDVDYLSVNGENLACSIVEDPKSILLIIKGRASLYDNELMITEMVGNVLEIGMGDEVTVSYGAYEGTYIVSGICQNTIDSGMSVTISKSALNRIIDKAEDKFNIGSISFALANPDDADPVIEAMREKYGENENIGIVKHTVESYVGFNVIDIMFIIQYTIYSFSAIFALAAVRMVTSKTFIQERREIGIYKAIGFTSRSLRLSFGIRFMITAVLGIALGISLSLPFSSRAVGLVLSLIGLTKMPSEYNFVSVAVPAAILMLCFFIFAFLSSGKVKRVQARELVTE